MTAIQTLIDYYRNNWASDTISEAKERIALEILKKKERALQLKRKNLKAQAKLIRSSQDALIYDLFNYEQNYEPLIETEIAFEYSTNNWENHEMSYEVDWSQLSPYGYNFTIEDTEGSINFELILTRKLIEKKERICRRTRIIRFNYLKRNIRDSIRKMQNTLFKNFDDSDSHLIIKPI